MTAAAQLHQARRRRAWWAVGIVSVLAMSAVAVWFGLAASVGRVHWVDTGHEIVSDREVLVRFDLRRDPDRTVACELEALDLSHARVGTATVLVPPGPTSPSRHIEAVRTVSPAVTGYVDSCWYADQ